jgi:hypothetical protein
VFSQEGQSTLTQEQRPALMESLFASLTSVGFFGKDHFIWEDGPDREGRTFTALPTHTASLMLCLRLKSLQIPLNDSLINPYFKFKTLVSSPIYFFILLLTTLIVIIVVNY